MTKIAYRSVHPDVQAHFDRHTKEYREWRDRVRTTLVDLGFPADRKIWIEGIRVVGVIRAAGDPIPDGWRRYRRAPEPVIVPARTTRLGKQFARTIGGLRQPDPRRGLPGGMPNEAMVRDQFVLMHCGFRVIGDAAFVTWPSDLSDSDSDRIDRAVWERIKLSEYFAALEAEDARQ